MKALLHRFHCHFWFKINMVNAYLAWHRGERILAAEYENDANRYQSELQRLEVLS